MLLQTIEIEYIEIVLIKQMSENAATTIQI